MQWKITEEWSLRITFGEAKNKRSLLGCLNVLLMVSVILIYTPNYVGKDGRQHMNESSVSTKFQTSLRQSLPGCVVIKHADKSMIGMVDASVTFNKKTIWMEYKYIKPATKGVQWREFMKEGTWEPQAVASASPTQFEFAKGLAKAGRCIYLFWVLDHEALRQRTKYVLLWCPVSQIQLRFSDTQAVVDYFVEVLKEGNQWEYETMLP